MTRILFIHFLRTILLFCICVTAHVAKCTETGLLGEGKSWQTPYYVIDTGADGPTVMVTGGVHGNEPAGFRAAEQIRHWPIVRGKLIVVPRANVLGLEQNIRYIPNAPVALQDLNRNFSGESLDDGPRGEIAAALWGLVTKYHPDWLFDLHEGHDFNISHEPAPGKEKSVGSSVIYHKGEDMDPLAEKMQQAANVTVRDVDRKFVLLGRGPKTTGMVSAAVRHLGIRGMILETTYNFQRLPVRTHQHRSMMSVALNQIGMLDRDCSGVMTPSMRDKALYIGVVDVEGVGESGVQNVAGLLDEERDMEIAHLGAHDLKEGVLSQFDVVVFGGGSGSKQAASIGLEAASAVRSFVGDGGGYLGICAGAFLCSAHYSWSLNLVDTGVFTGSRNIEGQGKKQMWYRGKTTTVEMQLTEEGTKIFAGVPEHVEVRYHNGPIVSPKNFEGLKLYHPLAFFRSEQVLYPPQKGTMINTPAIVMGEFGQGRVISISPHPEATEGLKSMIPSAIRAIARASN